MAIKNFAYDPSALKVRVGTTVTWTNGDSDAHTVTFRSGGVNSYRMATGVTFTYTFKAAGSYPYYCTIHTDMVGTITVTK